MRLMWRVAAGVVVLALAGCGGSSGGGSTATYTIGGTISGLSASGLVLANGADTVSPAANATSFVFPTALASGASYSVTVKTQPSGLTCSVTNGSGTVGSSDVTNVQVACTASAVYTIGGTISGLTQGGLMLANGADTVSPAANATSFVFPTALASGASYSVTVKTQPSGLTCSVTDGSGTVGSSNVTNVQVACTAIAASYTIGGTISGLTQGGLMLANGADNVSPAANATSFVFPTALATGVNYSVTVTTQPNGLTCSVTNGSGTVGSSNVTNVQVACTAIAASYTIGGTISGLTQGGLMLANGADTVSPVANATSFVFPTALATGASYSVTVKTQPSGLTCSVTNGSGTVGSSNVTNVQVTCTATGSYTIGGTITGLTAGGLMLANGADTVSPAANATSFVFPTPLASGANYSVTVSAQPSGLTCTVTNGSGTVASSDVTNVQVACSPTSTQTFVPLVVMPAGLAGATSGKAYSQTLTASGTGPFTWEGYTIADGNSLLNKYPTNGMNISTSGGVVSGTPYYTGTQPILISVSRADGAFASPQIELSIGGAGSSQSITNSPPSATQGQYYLWQLQTSWGYTGSNQGCGPGAHLVFGSIPPGLTYNSLNSTGGTLAGTPTMAGTYTMTLMADPGTTLCAPEPTNYATVTLTIAPASSPTTPAGSSNWTRQESSAVLTASNSGWDSYLVGSPSVISVGSTYYMYYEGLNTTSFTHAIGLATSTDGVNWTKGSGAVLQATTGAWDSTEVRYPSVVKNGGNYLMVYQGAGAGTALGLATSTDGTTWTKHSGAVVTTVGVHSAYVPGTLLYLSGQYVLYYTVDGIIGRMTSTDGVSWNDGGAVFSSCGSSCVVYSRPAVIYDGAMYRMWYTRIADANDGTEGTSGLFSVTIGYADSPDGETWTTYGNPILTAGAAGAWDRPGVGDPSVTYDGTTFRMWYVGGREQLPGGTPDSDTWVEGSVGYALIP